MNALNEVNKVIGNVSFYTHHHQRQLEEDEWLTAEKMAVSLLYHVLLYCKERGSYVIFVENSHWQINEMQSPDIFQFVLGSHQDIMHSLSITGVGGREQCIIYSITRQFTSATICGEVRKDCAIYDQRESFNK